MGQKATFLEKIVDAGDYHQKFSFKREQMRGPKDLNIDLFKLFIEGRLALVSFASCDMSENCFERLYLYDSAAEAGVVIVQVRLLLLVDELLDGVVKSLHDSIVHIMQIKKVFEFSCQCAVYKNEIRVATKGEKGKLRKVTLTLAQQFPPQARAPIVVGNKQATLEQLFSRQTQKQPPKEKEPLRPTQLQVFLSIFCGDDELYKIEIHRILNLKQAKLQQPCLSLQHEDGRIINLFDCPIETLANAKAAMLDLLQKYQEFHNTRPKLQPGSQTVTNVCPGTENNNSNGVPEIKKPELTEMQLLKLQRKRMAEMPEPERPQLQKNLKPSQSLQSNQCRKLSMLPPSLVFSILSFIPSNGIMKLRSINKQFDQVVCKMIKKLDFRRFYEVPLEVLVRLLAKFEHMESLHFGQLRNVKVSQLQDLALPKLSFLKTLDFRHYNYLTEKVASKLLWQYDSIENIFFPYNSKITSGTMQVLCQKPIPLKCIKFQEKERQAVNEQISFQSLAAVLHKRNPQKFKVPVIQAEIFEYYCKQYLFEENVSHQSELRELKLTHILFAQLGNQIQQSFNTFLEHHKQLSQLSIRSLFSKTQSLKHQALFDDQSFQRLGRLRQLSLGEFADDSFFKELVKHDLQLKSLKLRSKLVTDESLRWLFERCRTIESLNIAQCTSINGHGFEYLEDKSLTLEFPFINLVVSFDDYSLRCLENLLNSKAYEYKIKNVQLRKRQ